ncbi:MAG: SIS domain-containing protein [Lachnospiraceae bacterium]
MYDLVNEVFDTGLGVIEKLRNTQMENLKEAGKWIARAHMDGHRFFVSGSGHSHTVAEEFYGRAGGIAFPIPIMTTELTLEEHPTKSSYIERLPGYAKILAELYGIGNGDVVLIASNSGRNAYPIELAVCAKELGARVIAITNLNHSSKVTSRHESGKKLMDLADLVIDNCGVMGDAAIRARGMRTAICPTSSMANAFIVQSITAACVQELLENGVEPPVFVSLNADGNEQVNDEYFKKYTRMY